MEEQAAAAAEQQLLVVVSIMSVECCLLFDVEMLRSKRQRKKYNK